MNTDSMKKLQGDCVSWLVLLTGAAQLLLVCGEGSPAGMFKAFMSSATKSVYYKCIMLVCRNVPVFGDHHFHYE